MRSLRAFFGPVGRRFAIIKRLPKHYTMVPHGPVVVAWVGVCAKCAGYEGCLKWPPVLLQLLHPVVPGSPQVSVLTWFHQQKPS